MIQSSGKLVTGGQTGGQTNESAFIGPYPTNVERPTVLVILWKVHHDNFRSLKYSKLSN